MSDTLTERWAKPSADVTDLDMAFGGKAMDLMPAYEDIPPEFKRHSNTWVQFQSDWFFNGLKGTSVDPRDGIDRSAAMRHLKTIQGSWEPKHEHKEAGVAYLASRWFIRVKANGKVFGEPVSAEAAK